MPCSPINRSASCLSAFEKLSLNVVNASSSPPLSRRSCSAAQVKNALSTPPENATIKPSVNLGRKISFNTKNFSCTESLSKAVAVFFISFRTRPTYSVVNMFTSIVAYAPNLSPSQHQNLSANKKTVNQVRTGAVATRFFFSLGPSHLELDARRS